MVAVMVEMRVLQKVVMMVVLGKCLAGALKRALEVARAICPAATLDWESALLLLLEVSLNTAASLRSSLDLEQR